MTRLQKDLLVPSNSTIYFIRLGTNFDCILRTLDINCIGRHGNEPFVGRHYLFLYV